ncbi:acyl-CoA dehydrogenase family protein [bacterium]|nr:acyl-CoA dehydrogenase family protein [bacterium]
MPATDWLDLYQLDATLTDEERLIRQTVRAFVQKEARPRLAELWERGEFARELVPGMGALGLFGPTLTGYGLPGLGNRAYGLMMLELEAGDSGLRSFASVQSGLVMYPIHRYGSEAQKERWLPALAAGAAIGCFGLTEPDAGSDPGAMRTHAKRDGDDWILHGNKMWITNGNFADVAVVWAMTEQGVRGFLVEKGTPGFTTSRMLNKMSLRASDTAELHFDEVRLPDSARLPGAEGLGGPLSCLNQARYGIAWGTLGAAMACLEEAVDYAGQRMMFGKPIASKQLIQKHFADMLAGVIKGRLLVERLAELKDAGKASPVTISLAKRENCAMALDVARQCRQVLGANGISLEYQAGRHLANLESVITYEGTHEVHTLVLGQAITGESAFR